MTGATDLKAARAASVERAEPGPLTSSHARVLQQGQPIFPSSARSSRVFFLFFFSPSFSLRCLSSCVPARRGTAAAAARLPCAAELAAPRQHKAKPAEEQDQQTQQQSTLQGRKRSSQRQSLLRQGGTARQRGAQTPQRVTQDNAVYRHPRETDVFEDSVRDHLAQRRAKQKTEETWL